MTTRPADEPLIGIAELARRLDVPVATVYRWRRYGRGPKGFLIGRSVKFRWSDVEAWLLARREPESVVRSIRGRRST
jgi:excisionase family DNA binding protein